MGNVVPVWLRCPVRTVYVSFGWNVEILVKLLLKWLFFLKIYQKYVICRKLFAMHHVYTTRMKTSNADQFWTIWSNYENFGQILVKMVIFLKYRWHFWIFQKILTNIWEDGGNLKKWTKQVFWRLRDQNLFCPVGLGAYGLWPPRHSYLFLLRHLDFHNRPASHAQQRRSSGLEIHCISCAVLGAWWR